MELWFYLKQEPRLRGQHTRRRTTKNLHPRSSRARQESSCRSCPLDKDLSWKSGYRTCGLGNFTCPVTALIRHYQALRKIRLRVARLNSCFIPQSYEEITGTLAVRALFIAVISGCLAECTFAPIRCFDSTCVNATAALLAAGFATTVVYDPHVVTGAATLCTTRNRQFSLHLLMIRPCWCVPRVYVVRCQKSRVGNEKAD
jgi:hypothetical protein